MDLSMCIGTGKDHPQTVDGKFEQHMRSKISIQYTTQYKLSYLQRKEHRKYLENLVHIVLCVLRC